MSVHDKVAHLVGDWAGMNSLWLSPDEPARVSDTAASISVGMSDQVLSMQYTWSDKGRPQEGLIIAQYNPKAGEVTAAWTDTWHLRDTFMACRGGVDDQGTMTMAGTYAAPPDSDWGWRITIEPQTPSAFRLRMYNVSPAGESQLAVEAVYARTLNA